MILIFSVNSSQGFQGYARMASRIGSKTSSVWEHNVEILGGLFHLEWLCNREVTFRSTDKLCNPLNENKPVKISRDGQEIHPDVGYQLCKVIDAGEVYDSEKALQRMLVQASQRGGPPPIQRGGTPNQTPRGTFVVCRKKLIYQLI